MKTPLTLSWIALWTLGPALACDADPGPSLRGAAASPPTVAIDPIDPIDALESLAGPFIAALDPELELASADQESAGKPKKVEPKPAKDSQAAAWVRWVMALPYSSGPVNDPDGDSCAWGQEGSTWFLAGTSGGAVNRACDVPADRSLVFPLVNRWCVFFPEYFPSEASIEATEPEYVAFAASLPESVCSLTLKVDGVDVLADIDAMGELFVVTEERFDIDVNETDHFASAYDLAGGPMSAVTGGYYVRLKPLPAGEHVVELGGSLCEAGGAVVFDTRATYQLHVGD